MAVCALDGRTVISAAGGQTEFTIDWDATLIDDDDVLLWFEDVSAGTVGAEVTQGAGAGKFVVDRAAGTCTLGTAAEVGDIITIERHQSSPTRLTIFTQPGDFIPSVVNNEFDHYLQLLEDLGRDRCRSVRMDRGVSLTGLDLELPAPEVGRAIGWVDATTLGNIGIAFAGGSGTLNTIPLWTPDGLTLGDSVMTQSSTLITIVGTLTVNSDVDGTTILGRTKIGSPAADVMYLSHFDNLTTEDYAIRQTTTGSTSINAKAGATVAIRINDVALVTINTVDFSTSLGVVTTGTYTAGSGSTVLTTAVGLLRHQAIDPAIAGSGLSVSSGVLSADSGDLSGSGTNNTIPLWTPDGDTLGDSIIAQSGVTITLAGTLIVSLGDITVVGQITAGSSVTLLTTIAGLLRHQAIDPSIAGSGITYTAGVLSVTSGLSGSGTENTIPLWGAGGVVLGDSTLTQIGSSVVATAAEFVVRLDSAGNTISLSAFNQDNTDLGSDALVNATVAGASGGDPYSSWAVASVQSYTLGIDNSEDDKFVGSVGGALGTGNWLEVTTARGITLDAASGQTVALAVNSTPELTVSGTAVTLPTNNLIITVGKMGIQTAALESLLNVGGNSVTTIMASANNEGIQVVPGVLRGRVLIEGTTQGELILVDSGGTGNRRTSGLRSADDKTTFAAYNDVGGVVNDNIIVMDHDTGNVGVGVIPTLPFDVLAKAGITPIGGYAIKMTNKNGSAMILGQLVIASTGTANACELAGVSDDRVIGIVLEGGVADGDELWIVVAGFAMVLMDAGGAALGDRIISSTTAGSGLVSNGPASAIHFQEVGHAVGAVGGAQQVKCAVHFN